MNKTHVKEKALIYVPYIIYGSFMSALVFTREFFGDDISLLDYYHISLSDWISFLYYNWSSRILVEMFIPALCYYPVIWMILSVAISLLMYYSLQKLFCNTPLSRLALLLCLLIFPYHELSSAGWITTTVVYLWPISFGFFSLLSIKKIINAEKINLYWYTACCAALLFAANNEVLAAILFPVFLAYYIYFRFNKKICNSKIFILIVQSGICAANIIFAAVNPGNYARQVAETRSRWPDFADLGFINKIYLGFNTTMHHIVIRDNLLFLTFCVLLLVLVFYKREQWKYRLTAVFPCFLSVFLNAFLPGSPLYYRGSEYINNTLSFQTLFYTIIFILIILCIIISVYFALGKSETFLLVILIMGLGLASRVIMGFSPTLFASNTRTFSFLWISIICCIMILYDKLEEVLMPKAMENIVLILFAAAFFSSNAINMLSKVWRTLIG